MFGSGSDNQTTIKRKTKIKEKHKYVDPNMMQPQQTVYTQQPILTGVQPGLQRNRSSSSSSSSSNEERRAQQQGLGTQMGMGQNYIPPMQTTTMPTTMTQPMNQPMMGSGFANQGLTGQGPMVTQYVDAPMVAQTGNPDVKVSTYQKIKEKIFHHGQQGQQLPPGQQGPYQ